MIDFSTVSREFQGLVARRREQITFLGSVFAALSLFLQNALQGNLPRSLGGIERHLFAFYGAMLFVPSFITALRMARLHGGMVLNGIYYAHLLQATDFAPPGNPVRAGRHNFLGVSFLYFLLANLLAGFSATALGLALRFHPIASAAIGSGFILFGLIFYFRFHAQAAAVALRRIAKEPRGAVSRSEWEDHVSRSLEEANLGMLTDIAFVGLIMFSVFEVLSSLGRVDQGQSTELDASTIEAYGPLVFTSAMFVVSVFGLLTYIRVRVAIGQFSLWLDPTDRPFRPLRLTDSLLGYLLLAFLFAVSVHLLLVQLMPWTEGGEPWLLAIDALAFCLAVLMEQLTLIFAGQAVHRRLQARPISALPEPPRAEPVQPESPITPAEPPAEDAPPPPAGPSS